MKLNLFLATALTLTATAARAQAQDCRLKTPVTLTLDVLAAKKEGEKSRLAFNKVTLDHVPVGAVSDVREKQNGDYTLQVHQIFYNVGFFVNKDEQATGMYGVILSGGLGMGAGFGEGYNGMTLQSQTMQQNGEMVYTTTDANNKVARILTLKTRGNQITSIELKNPVTEEIDPGVFRQTGATDTLCVLSMTPVPPDKN